MAARILIVEDDLDNLEVLGLLLGGWGYDVILADTGEAAVGLVAAHDPQIVLLDLDLPGIQGEDVARILKAMADPPFVIAYTGFERLESDALAAGCDAFLVKPGLDKLAALLVAIPFEDVEEA